MIKRRCKSIREKYSEFDTSAIHFPLFYECAISHQWKSDYIETSEESFAMKQDGRKARLFSGPSVKNRSVVR